VDPSLFDLDDARFGQPHRTRAERDADELLEGLNPEQREAVLHGEGPILIVAGAGSGKTRVLTQRIAYLIRAREVSPFEILAITFTNKAAGEMRERVGELVGSRLGQAMWVMTFHSACGRILRKEAARLGYTRSFRASPKCGPLSACFAILPTVASPRRRPAPRTSNPARPASRCSPTTSTPRTSR